MLYTQTWRERKLSSGLPSAPPCGSPGISKGSTLTQGALSWVIHAVFDAPVHDVANEGAGEETEQLHDSEDGGVELHCAGTELGSGCQQLGGHGHPPPAEEDSQGEPRPKKGTGQSKYGPGICLPVSCTFCLCSWFSVGRDETR